MADFFQQSIFKKRIPTIIGILVLLVGGVAGILAVGRSTNFLPKASPEHAPKQIKITGVSSDSFTVSWLTDSATSGFLRYGTTTSLSTTQADERDLISDSPGNYRLHYVTIHGLSPGTKYYFKLGSGDSGLYDNNGQPFEITLGTQLNTAGRTAVLSGNVVTNAQTPAVGAIVYANIPGAAPVSALVRNSGSWVINLAELRTTNLSALYKYSDSDSASLEIISATGETTTGTAELGAFQESPPTITLGQTFNLTAQEESRLISTDTGEDAEATQSATSQFDTKPLGGVTPATGSAITLANPSFDGETVNTTKPEIIGTAPANTKITITVESDPIYEEQLTTDTDGSFAWSPPANLAAGNHTITISYTDAKGILQTLKRSFVVMAAGESELPALTSSPSGQSATPTPTPKPSPSPTASGSARVSIPSSGSGTPTAGTITPPIVITLLGLLLNSSGLVLSKKITV